MHLIIKPWTLLSARVTSMRNSAATLLAPLIEPKDGYSHRWFSIPKAKAVATETVASLDLFKWEAAVWIKGIHLTEWLMTQLNKCSKDLDWRNSSGREQKVSANSPSWRKWRQMHWSKTKSTKSFKRNCKKKNCSELQRDTVNLKSRSLSGWNSEKRPTETTKKW